MNNAINYVTKLNSFSPFFLWHIHVKNGWQ